MASEYPNSGALFKNDRKGNNEKAPDYKGKIDIDGEQYDLVGWIKEGKRGKFLSLKINPAGMKYGRPQGADRPGDPF